MNVPQACAGCRPEYGDCLNARCFLELQVERMMRRVGAEYDTEEVQAEILFALRRSEQLRVALEAIRALDFKKNPDGSNDLYSGAGQFVRAWLIADAALKLLPRP
jgi:hypothetical protein